MLKATVTAFTVLLGLFILWTENHSIHAAKTSAMVSSVNHSAPVASQPIAQNIVDLPIPKQQSDNVKAKNFTMDEVIDHIVRQRIQSYDHNNG
ncbi:hypothetical protein [Kaarinaea lacus]